MRHAVDEKPCPCSSASTAGTNNGCSAVLPTAPDKAEIARKHNGISGGCRTYYADSPSYLMCMCGEHGMICRNDGLCWNHLGHDYRPVPYLLPGVLRPQWSKTPYTTPGTPRGTVGVDPLGPSNNKVCTERWTRH